MTPPLPTAQSAARGVAVVARRAARPMVRLSAICLMGSHPFATVPLMAIRRCMLVEANAQLLTLMGRTWTQAGPGSLLGGRWRIGQRSLKPWVEAQWKS